MPDSAERQTRARNRAVIDRFERAVTELDDTVLEQLCAPDMANHSLAASPERGLEGTRRFLQSQRERGAHSHWAHVVVLADQDYVVQFGSRTGVWPGGSFRGFEVPRGEYTRDCAFMYRLRDGLITDRWAIRDDLALLLERGAITLPSS